MLVSGYNAYIISTIVDLATWISFAEGYNAYIISTIVDEKYQRHRLYEAIMPI